MKNEILTILIRKNEKDELNSHQLGGAVGGGVTLANVRGEVAKPMDKDFWKITAPVAVEVGVSSSKADVDGGASISIPFTQRK